MVAWRLLREARAHRFTLIPKNHGNPHHGQSGEQAIGHHVHGTRNVMSTFSTLNVFKSLSKAIAQQQDWKLSEARERLSLAAGFSSYYDLQCVGQRRPDDPRLLRFVFGVETFADVVFLPRVVTELGEQVIQRALQDDLAPKAPDVRMHMENLLVESLYDADKGVLVASGKAELTCVEQTGYEQLFSQQFQWFSAILAFEVKFRDQSWQLVCSSISMHLEVNDDDEDFLEDSIDDFPSSEFWD